MGSGAKRFWRLSAAASFIALAAFTVPAASNADERPLFVSLGDAARAPVGWIEFCEENPRECAGQPDHATRRRALDAGLEGARAHQPVGQQPHQADDRPRTLGRGRAMDLSRRRLRRLRGLRAAQAPHADAGGLAARGAARSPWCATSRATATPCSPSRPTRANSFSTTRTSEILLWSDTGYRFVKRQSQADPNVWISLGDPRAAPATATSR